MTLSIIGTCPVCEGEFCTKTGPQGFAVMVHHGFQRPGHGSIVGDCYAVGMKAYELSSKGCEDYKAFIEVMKVGQEEYIARIPTVTHFSKTEKHWRTGAYEKTSFSVFVTDPIKWARLREMEMSNAQHTLEHQIREIARMDRLIKGWTLGELRSEKRADVAKALEVAARKAERLAKKAEKDAKAQALQAKREAKSKVRLDAAAEFAKKLEVIRSTTDTKLAKEHGAERAWKEFFSLKNSRQMGDLYECYTFLSQGHGQLLVDLGLAKQGENGSVYPYLSWVY